MPPWAESVAPVLWTDGLLSSTRRRQINCRWLSRFPAKFEVTSVVELRVLKTEWSVRGVVKRKERWMEWGWVNPAHAFVGQRVWDAYRVT